ncbi:MAG: hypothetical protein Q7T71_00900 [Herbiconiux sp.]|nr:hypothetical protein [Herbiconiux sp.]
MDDGVDEAARRDRLRAVLEAWPGTPAFVRDRHLTVVASNELARAVSPGFADGVNLLRFTFLSGEIDRSEEQWPVIAAQSVGLLRDSLEQHDDDQAFRGLVGELSALSRSFSSAWADENGSVAHSGPVTFATPGRPDLRLVYQELRLPDEHEHVLVVWRAADQASRRRLDALMSRSGATPSAS